MFSRLRNRLGWPGLIISVIALVFAMFGGAYAASGGLTGKQKKEVTAIAKSQAKKGPKGATGPAGPIGAQGAAGAAGAKGDKGDAGSVGSAGPTGSAGAKGATGLTGSTGPTGITGPTGNIGDTLPSGTTETGVWALRLNPPEEGFEFAFADISFAIPLEEELDATQVHLINKEDEEVKKLNLEGFIEEELVTPTKCLGTVREPTAEAGNLCVYRADTTPNARLANSTIQPGSSTSIFAPGGADVVGARLTGFVVPSGPAQAFGTWAVTAP
jgi:hypothetical protein